MTTETRQMRRARERAEAKRILRDNKTQLSDRVDWSAIRADTGAMRLDQFLMETLDDNPDGCASAIASLLMGLQNTAEMDFLYQSAAKGVNTHGQGLQMHIGSHTFDLKDYYIEVRNVERAGAEHLVKEFIREWSAGATKLLMPAVYISREAGRGLGINSVISYNCVWGTQAVQLCISPLQQPNGVIKTQMEIRSVPMEVYVNWQAVRDTNEIGAAVSW